MAIEVAQKSFPAKVTTFYNEVLTEMRKVTWPDRPQLQDTTWKIIVFVLFLGAIIGLVDVILQQVLVRWIPAIFAR